MLSVLLQISAEGPFIDVVEVKSCAVSSLSDPKKSRFWTLISDGCSSDPSLTLGAKTKDEEEEEAEGDDEPEEEKEETEGLEKGETYDRDGDVSLRGHVERRGREASARMEKSSRSMRAEEIQPLRFSFILRPVYNDSIQFLHCSLRLCVSDSTGGEPMTETVKTDCQGGLRIPPLISRSPRHQVQKQLTRYISQHKTNAE